MVQHRRPAAHSDRQIIPDLESNQQLSGIKTPATFLGSLAAS